jgi:hypothetical protein
MIYKSLQHQQMHNSTIMYFATTCFGITAIIRQLTSVLLKLTAIKYRYSAYAYPMYRLQLKILTIISQLNSIHTLQSCSFKTRFNIILQITSKHA